MNLGDLNKVWEVKVLKKPGDDEARKMLEKIAKQVQPIMKKHKWRVKVLSEFCPANPSLLGLNVGGGVQIKLRLRRSNRDWDFIPYEQVLDTMLHELCHNEHGPHNASFYKLWDELRKECEEFVSKGITGTGQGFDLQGRRLGGKSHQPPLSALRQAALSAAEKRQRLGSLLPSGPRRLGGDNNIMDALSPIQAAAMAAERRMQDDIWCGSACAEAIIEETSGRTSPQSGYKRSWKDTDELAAPATNTSDSGEEFHQSSVGASTSHTIETLGGSASSPLYIWEGENTVESAPWECRTCTLLNKSIAPICEACGSQKPMDSQTKYKNWSCKFCTLENSVTLNRCTACDQWRYSYGAPAFTFAPHLGT